MWQGIGGGGDGINRLRHWFKPPLLYLTLALIDFEQELAQIIAAIG